MKQAIVVCIIISRQQNHKTKILLTKRPATTDFMPGFYEIPGGHLEHGEDLITGLKREIKEELNLEISVGDLISAFTYTNQDTHTVELVYLGSLASDFSELKIQKDEISEVVWIEESEIDTLIINNKSSNDQEIPILRKAFKLLSNRTP